MANSVSVDRCGIIQSMKKKVVKKTESVYAVTLKLGNSTLEGRGDTVLSALRSIQKPVKITTKSVLTVSKGDKKHSRGLTIPLAKRLFYPAAQQYLAKDLQLLMK